MIVVASNPGSHPAFRRLQYGKALFRTASDEKLDESLGLRLPLSYQLMTLFGINRVMSWY